MVRKLYKYGLLSAALTTTLAVLTVPARAQISAGFYENSSGVINGFSWNVDTNAVAFPANGDGGNNVALFGVSENAVFFCGVGDDTSGIFHGATWNGVNGAATIALVDSGAGQGLPGNDTPWSINDLGFAVGEGVGQIQGYDTGFFSEIEWTSPTMIVDLNTYTDPVNYGGPVYLEGYDITGGLVGSAAGINDAGDISGTAFQNFGSFYYQGVIAHAGQVYIIPYVDAADPAATSWNISSSSATTGYNFINSLSQAVGYTASVGNGLNGHTYANYTYGATGGSGNLAIYGSGPNNNFIWFLDTNDDGSGNGQAVGFDIDSSGSFNHDIYARNDKPNNQLEISDDRGGNTSFLVGVANDGSSAGFETKSADGEAYFHAWGTKTGTPGPTTDFPEPPGTAGSKAYEIASGGFGGPGVQTFTGAFKKGQYKPIVLKHGKTAKVSVVLTSAAGGSGQVVTVTSSNTSAIANFTLTVPAGQTTLNNVKTPKVSKKAKGQTVTLTACANGVCQSATVTVK